MRVLFAHIVGGRDNVAGSPQVDEVCRNRRRVCPVENTPKEIFGVNGVKWTDTIVDFLPAPAHPMRQAGIPAQYHRTVGLTTFYVREFRQERWKISTGSFPARRKRFPAAGGDCDKVLPRNNFRNIIKSGAPSGFATFPKPSGLFLRESRTTMMNGRFPSDGRSIDKYSIRLRCHAQGANEPSISV